MADFYVIPTYDDQIKRWYTVSNVIGLNLETDTPDALLDLVKHFAPELIESNHPEVATMPECPAL
ncbi:MAG: hypothetical protein ACU0CO_16125 [Shimia sp.]